jgi:(E)-4-hydroxy-3-methyl-but-2-enyl pyrophosphate reductase
MAVKLAKNAGFCMGVRRAMDMVLDIARHMGNEKIYTYGPLIHNPQTVELLKKRGIIPLDSIEGITEGTIIIRAHGISPAERRNIKARGIKIIDATCPKVANVQAIIKKHAALDYTVLIVGEREHPEVEGLLGYSAGKGMVIGSGDEIAALPALGKVCVVAQTTQNRDEYRDIAAGIAARFPETLIFDTICESTDRRQAEVMEMAAGMDAMIIVGGRNSANTRRLAEISNRKGAPTFHIETAEDLQQIDLRSFKRIGVSAGASTPNWIIEKVLDDITAEQREREKGNVPGLLNLWIFAVRTDVYSAVGAGCLLFTSTILQGLPLSFINIAIAALYVFSMHRLNRITDRKIRGMEDSFSGETYRRHQKTYVSIAVLSMVAALALSFLSGPAPFILLFLISSIGMLYAVRIFPQGWRFERMKDLPGSKNILTALAWASVTALVPQIERSLTVTIGMLLAFFFNFALVFVKSTLSDMINIQSDRLIGRETIPVLIGEKKTRNLLVGSSVLLFAVMTAAYPLGGSSTLSFALLTCIFYVWICFYLYDRRAELSSIVMEGLLQTNYVIAGLSTLSWLFMIRMI